MAAFFQTEAFVDNTCRVFSCHGSIGTKLTTNLDASVKLVGWSIAEPGMYLVAACSLKFRPVFVALGRMLHIRNIYGSGSTRGRAAASNGKEVPLNALPSREQGFNKIRSGSVDTTSTTNIVATHSSICR
jgi:hypothetical protein